MSDYRPTRHQRRCRHVWLETGRDRITQAVYQTCWKCKLVQKTGGIFAWAGSGSLMNAEKSNTITVHGDQIEAVDSNASALATEDGTPEPSAARFEE